ncbi:MAG TPA: hypothetical protein VGG99_13830 [Acetobacteraceae bacterium]
MNVRLLSLARIALEAEGLRLRRRARRGIVRGVLGMIALLWVFGAVVFAHIAIWDWLRDSMAWSAMGTAWALAGGDAVIACVAALIAAQLGPGRVELEALAVRARAVEAATTSLALSALLMQALRIGLNLVRRRGE